MVEIHSQAEVQVVLAAPCSDRAEAHARLGDVGVGIVREQRQKACGKTTLSRYGKARIGRLGRHRYEAKAAGSGQELRQKRLLVALLSVAIDDRIVVPDIGREQVKPWLLAGSKANAVSFAV